MSNALTLEIYVPKQDALYILADDSVTHLLVKGTVEITSESTCKWMLESVSYPGEQFAGGAACPQPCPATKAATSQVS
jgi:hypothetical protein